VIFHSENRPSVCMFTPLPRAALEDTKQARVRLVPQLLLPLSAGVTTKLRFSKTTDSAGASHKKPKKEKVEVSYPSCRVSSKIQQCDSQPSLFHNKEIHNLACSTKEIDAAQRTPPHTFPAVTDRESLSLTSIHDLENVDQQD